MKWKSKIEDFKTWFIDYKLFFFSTSRKVDDIKRVKVYL